MKKQNESTQEGNPRILFIEMSNINKKPMWTVQNTKRKTERQGKKEKGRKEGGREERSLELHRALPGHSSG